jgi:methyl coenzyme M reductase subunit D
LKYGNAKGSKEYCIHKSRVLSYCLKPFAKKKWTITDFGKFENKQDTMDPKLVGLPF